MPVQGPAQSIAPITLCTCLWFQLLGQFCFQPYLPCKPMVVAVQPDPLHSFSALLQTSGNYSIVGANSHNLHKTWFPCMPLCITDLFIMSRIPLSAPACQWSLKPSSNQPAPLSSPHILPGDSLSNNFCPSPAFHALQREWLPKNDVPTLSLLGHSNSGIMHVTGGSGD